MAVYNAKVIKNEIVSGGEYHPYPIEIWTTFSVKEKKIEAFLGLPPFDPQVGSTYSVDFRLMTYDIYRINIEEKMLKQISTFPKDPLYFLMGKVVDLKECEREHKGKIVKSIWLLIDCGIEIETDVAYFKASELKIGDYVAIIGKMFGEIVRE